MEITEDIKEFFSKELKYGYVVEPFLDWFNSLYDVEYKQHAVEKWGKDNLCYNDKILFQHIDLEKGGKVHIAMRTPTLLIDYERISKHLRNFVCHVYAGYIIIKGKIREYTVDELDEIIKKLSFKQKEMLLKYFYIYYREFDRKSGYNDSIPKAIRRSKNNLQIIITRDSLTDEEKEILDNYDNSIWKDEKLVEQFYHHIDVKTKPQKIVIELLLRGGKVENNYWTHPDILIPTRNCHSSIYKRKGIRSSTFQALVKKEVIKLDSGWYVLTDKIKEKTKKFS